MNYHLSRLLLGLFLTFILKCNGDHHVQGVNDSFEKQLRDELFKKRNYDTHVVPVNDKTKSIKVSVDLSLIKLNSVDIKTHVMTIESWVSLSWNDLNLKWNPAEFGGLEVIRVGSDEIFKPDIMLYNSANFKEMKESLVDTKALVFSNGLVMWIPPSTMQAVCHGIDLTNWPSDEHECFLKFGSWTYDGNLIDLDFNKTKGLDLSDYWISPEWNITHTSVEKHNKYYPCCSEPYPDIKYTIRIKRKTSLYYHTVLLPSTIAVLLGLMTFWFPLRSSIRLILPGFSLIILTLMMLYLGGKLGMGTKGMPLALKCLAAKMVAVSLVMVWSTIGFNLSGSSLNLPNTLEKLLVPLARFIKETKTGEHDMHVTVEDAALIKQAKLENKTSSLKVFAIILDKVIFVALLSMIIIKFYTH
jgi:nicotinic acetylcholine receptor